MSDDVEIRSEMSKRAEVDINAVATSAKIYIRTYIRELQRTNPGLESDTMTQDAYDYWLGTQAPDEVKNDASVLQRLTRTLQRGGLSVSMPTGTTPPEEEGAQPVGVGGGAPRRPEGEEEDVQMPGELESLPSMAKEMPLPPWQVGRRENIYEFGEDQIVQADLPEKNFKQFVAQFEYAVKVWKIENSVENFVKFLNKYKVNAKIMTPAEVDEYHLSTGDYTKNEDGKVTKNIVHDRDRENSFVEVKKELRQLLRPNLSKQELEDKIIDLGLKMKALPEGKEKAELQKQIDNEMSNLGMYEWYEASRKNNFQKTGGRMKDKIVREGSVGTRGMGSFMESFVAKAKEIVTAKPTEKTATKVVQDFPERMSVADAEMAGFFKSAKSCGWGAFASEPLDGGIGGIWFTEKGDDGKDYLVKQVTQEGEAVRRFKEKQASLKKQSVANFPHGGKTPEEDFIKLPSNWDTMTEDEKDAWSLEHKNKSSIKGRFPGDKKPAGAGFDRAEHDRKMEDFKKASEEPKSRGTFTVYTKKPGDVKGPALGEKEAKEKKEKGVFDIYKSKPAENIKTEE